ncbi:hypothetical protein AQUCO_00700791v1 [Aquilegia coerulea]|uniref:Uncharacterized protein n=1 Tax=Aquilegia coerulea TaxID=218851 RepID=A0A2G5ELP0_AQUCA|nr:hypothetical protein AQUCO_00700791v1 [Aquilegia coerulea]PIA56672.1 hypothetical protein AQUCO_00700791v1 [Aquilegia coerulea]
MAWRSGSFSRSLLSAAARTSSRRSSPTSLPRLRSPPPLSAPRQQQRRFSFSNPRTMESLGCIQSLLPLHNVVASSLLTSHLTLNARACCELSQGIGDDG